MWIKESAEKNKERKFLFISMLNLSGKLADFSRGS